MTNENKSADLEEEKPDEKKEKKPNELILKKEKLKRYTKYIYIGIAVIPLILGALASELVDSPEPIVFAIGLSVALFLAYLGLSYRFWDPILGNQIAFLSLFGEPVMDLSAGIPFAPLFITRVVRYDRPIRQREFPAEPSKVYEGEMKDADDLRNLPPGFKPPIRITFRDHLPKELVKKIILKEDMVVLDLQKMEPEEVKIHWLEAVAQGDKIDLKKKPEQKKEDWGVFSYRELRHLEKIGRDSHAFDKEKAKLEKEIDDPENNLTEEEIKKRKVRIRKINGEIKKIKKVYSGVLHTIEFYPGIPREPKDGQEEAAEALNRRVTAMVVPVVRWMINEPIKFYLEIGSDKEVDRQIEDEMISVLQRLLPKISVGQALENINWINAHLYAAVVKRTLKWGIKVEGAFQKQIKLNHNLNKAIAALPQAIYQGEAEGERETRKGKGVAAAARALEHETLAGRASGMEEIKKKLDIDGSEVQSAEVARDVADGGNVVVVGSGGMSDLVGIAAAAAFGKKGSKSDPKPKPVEADLKPESDKEE